MKWFKEWLSESRLADPLERETSPTVQLTLIGAGAVSLLVWLLGVGRGSGLGNPLLLVFAALAIVALAMHRRGQPRISALVLIAGFLVPLGVTLLAYGLRAQVAVLPLMLLPIITAALVAGRRTLWMVLVAVIGIPALASLQDVPSVWPTISDALNPLHNVALGSHVLVAILLTVVLAAFGSLARGAYQRSARQALSLREASDRLSSAEARFHASVEGCLDAFLVLEAVRDQGGSVIDFRVAEFNSRATRLLALDGDSLRGAMLSAICPGVFVAGGSFATWSRVVESRRMSEREGAPDVPLAGIAWMREQVVPVGDGVAVMIRDLTHLRDAENAVTDLRAQFLQAQKMEVVGVLAGSVAHDFNNLLTVIGGHAELLLTDGLSEDSREGVEQILHATSRAVELTRSLLAFSRKRDTSPMPIRLRDVLQRSRPMWQRVLGLPVTLNVELDDDRPVLLDEGEFDQVLLNLLVNARDAMPQGGQIILRLTSGTLGHIASEGAAGATSRPWVILEVQDTGIGMDEETAAHIFEPFYTTKPAGRGTGLGLSTVRRLVTEQGGCITVESSPGKGSTFRLYWPQAEVPATGVPHADTPARSGGSETIMFLDDDPAVNRLFEAGLSGMGYRILAAASGREAEEIAERVRPDLLVTDLMLPDRHGSEVAARMRKRFPGMPIIYFTGSTERVATDEPRQVFLQKPVTPRELASYIRSALDEGASRQ